MLILVSPELQSFEQANPIIVRLSAQKQSLRDRLREKRMDVVLLGGGREITERYLTEGAASTSSDLEIDTTRLTRRQVLEQVINYLRKR